MNSAANEEKTYEDPYTGEEKPPAEDVEDIIEVVPVEGDEHEGEEYLLGEETSMDKIATEEAPDAIAQRSTRHTQNDQTEETFEELQQLAVSGREELEQKLEKYHAKSPDLSGGDLDADWEKANAAGEETVGGKTPTPDQDVVDELGEAAGLTYEPEEPLDSQKKLLQRDQERWMLDPDSRQEERQPPNVRDQSQKKEDEKKDNADKPVND